MAENKKSFLLYCDLIHTVKKMPKEKAGELFMHILEYVNDLEPNTDDLIIQLTFEPIRQSLKRDLEKYERIRLKNKENADKRWNKNNTTECDRIQPNAKNADNDNDNVSDSDILLKKETKEENLSKENPIEIFPQSESVEPGAEERKKVAQKKEKELKPDLDTFIEYARLVYQNELKIDFSPFIFAVTSKFNDWNDSGWNDGNGKPILSWKNKLRNSIPYFKPINNNSHGNTKTPTNKFNSNQSQTRTGRQILAERLINSTKANGESGSTIIDVEAL